MHYNILNNSYKYMELLAADPAAYSDYSTGMFVSMIIVIYISCVLHIILLSSNKQNSSLPLLIGYHLSVRYLKS